METNNNKKNRFSAADLAYCGLALALMIVCAKVSLPVQPIPLALLTFGVMLIAMLLGARRAFWVQLTYLVLGLAGLPIFARGGGPGYVLMPSFGYILGFVLASLVTGTLFERFCQSFKRGATPLRVWWAALLAGTAGLLCIYALGLLYWILLAQFYLGTDKTLGYFLYSGAIVFIPSDMLSIFLATVATSSLYKLLPRLHRAGGARRRAETD